MFKIRPERSLWPRIFAMAGAAPAASPIAFDGLDTAIAEAAQAERLSRRMERCFAFDPGARELSIRDEMFAFTFDLQAFVQELSALNDEPVTVSINSPGGDAFLGIAIYNALVRYSGEVTVRIDGIAASAASLVAMAGDRIVVPENGFIMVHNPASIAAGTDADFRRVAGNLEKVREAYARTYAKRTGADQAAVQAFMDGETYFTAEQAKDAGFATEIAPPIRIGAFDAARLPGKPPTALLEAMTPTAEDPPSAPAPATPAPATPAPMAAAPAPAPAVPDPAPAPAQPAAATMSAQERATWIADLCALADCPERAAEFIASDQPLAQIRAAIRALKPKAPHRLPDNRLPSPTSGQLTASINPVEAWAKWNKRGRSA